MHDKPPFCWCHDDLIPDEIFEANDGILDYPDDADDADAHQPDAAPQEPQDGQEHETHETTWDEFIYYLTNGAMGTKPPETPRRYEPPHTKR